MTTEDHQVITNILRREIPYGKPEIYDDLTKAQVKEIYEKAYKEAGEELGKPEQMREAYEQLLKAGIFD